MLRGWSKFNQSPCTK